MYVVVNLLTCKIPQRYHRGNFDCVTTGVTTYESLYTQIERLDFDRSNLAAGDIVLVPANNAIQPPPFGALALLEEVSFPSAGWIATMARPLGAGFHLDVFGPLPFAVGRAPREVYGVFGVTEPMALRRAPGFESTSTVR